MFCAAKLQTRLDCSQMILIPQKTWLLLLCSWFWVDCSLWRLFFICVCAVCRVHNCEHGICAISKSANRQCQCHLICPLTNWMPFEHGISAMLTVIIVKGQIKCHSISHGQIKSHWLHPLRWQCLAQVDHAVALEEHKKCQSTLHCLPKCMRVLSFGHPFRWVLTLWVHNVNENDIICQNQWSSMIDCICCGWGSIAVDQLNVDIAGVQCQMKQCCSPN